MKKYVLAAALCLAVGCSTPMNVVMRNPETGKTIYIAHYGYGSLMAVATAYEQQRKAIEAAKMMGYTEMNPVK